MSLADELGKLDALRKQGILTDAEFEQRKRSLLGEGSGTSGAKGNVPYSEWSQVPLKNKWWFQGLLTLLIIPIGLIFVLFFRSYQKKKGAVVRHPGVGFKIFFVIAMLFLWGVIASLGANPGSQSSSNATSPSAEMVKCDSYEAREALVDAIEQNATRNIATLRLLDLQNVQEVSYDAETRTRRCNATFVLNSGRESSGYTLSPASTPDSFLVEIGS